MCLCFVNLGDPCGESPKWSCLLMSHVSLTRVPFLFNFIRKSYLGIISVFVKISKNFKLLPMYWHIYPYYNKVQLIYGSRYYILPNLLNLFLQTRICHIYVVFTTFNLSYPWLNSIYIKGDRHTECQRSIGAQAWDTYRSKTHIIEKQIVNII